MSKFYYITNFINEYFEGYDCNKNPELTCFEEEAIQMTLLTAEKELDKLHKKGYTGLKLTEVKD